MGGTAVDLTGRVALVTGGAKRTGRVIAKRLAAAGASVVVNALSSRVEAEATVREIEAAEAMASRFEIFEQLAAGYVAARPITPSVLGEVRPTPRPRCTSTPCRFGSP